MQLKSGEVYKVSYYEKYWYLHMVQGGTVYNEYKSIYCIG